MTDLNDDLLPGDEESILADLHTKEVSGAFATAMLDHLSQEMLRSTGIADVFKDGSAAGVLDTSIKLMPLDKPSNHFKWYGGLQIHNPKRGFVTMAGV